MLISEQEIAAKIYNSWPSAFGERPTNSNGTYSVHGLCKAVTELIDLLTKERDRHEKWKQIEQADKLRIQARESFEAWLINPSPVRETLLIQDVDRLPDNAQWQFIQLLKKEQEAKKKVSKVKSAKRKKK